MEQDRAVEVRIHADLSQATAHFLGNDLRCVGFANPAIAAQHVKDEQIRNCGAIGEASTLHPGDASLRKLSTKFREQARLAYTGIANHAERMALPTFRLGEEIV